MHHAFVLVHGFDQLLHTIAYDQSDFFGTEAFGQRGESREISEDHRHLTPLAFDMSAGPNLIGQLFGHISLQFSEQSLIARGRFAVGRQGFLREQRSQHAAERFEAQLNRRVAQRGAHAFLRRDRSA